MAGILVGLAQKLTNGSHTLLAGQLCCDSHVFATLTHDCPVITPNCHCSCYKLNGSLLSRQDQPKAILIRSEDPPQVKLDHSSGGRIKVEARAPCEGWSDQEWQRRASLAS